MGRRGRYKKKWHLFLVLVILFCNLIVPVQAHDVYMFVTLIDNQTFSYKGYVLFDAKSTTNDGMEHLEKKLGNFQAIGEGYTYDKDYLEAIEGDSTAANENSTAAAAVVIDGTYNIWTSKALVGGAAQTNAAEEAKKPGGADNLIFSFPSKNIDDSNWSKIGFGILGGRNNATSLDQSRAYYVKDTLLQNLNQALYFINNNKNFTSVKALVMASHDLAEGGETETGYTVEYNTSDGICTITSPDGVVQEFVWSVPKGYTQEKLEAGVPNALYRDEYDGTIENITWIHCIEQANYCYMSKGFSSSTVSSLKEPSAIVKGVTEVFTGFLEGLRSNLGLWDLDDLFFNNGIRGNSQIYKYGAITVDRYKASVTGYQLSLIIGLSIINIAFTYLIAQFVWDSSTMKKIRLADGSIRLIFGAMGVFLVYPIFTTLLQLNAMIVSILGTAHVMPFKNYAYASGMIENILLEIYYFFIMVYFNIMYVIREFTLLLLLGAGPIFIISIAFDSRMTLLKKWFSLLIYSIFMQSVHIFVLSTLLPNIVAGRGIEQVVGYFILIPLTTAFKTALLGKEGAFMGTLSGTGAAIASAVPLQMGASFIGGMTNSNASQRAYNRGSEVDTSTPLSTKNAIAGRSHLTSMAKPLNSSTSISSGNSSPMRPMVSTKGVQVARGVGGAAARMGAQVASTMPYAAMALALGGENQQAAKIASIGMAHGAMGVGAQAGEGAHNIASHTKQFANQKLGEFKQSDFMQKKYTDKIKDGKNVNPLKQVSVGPNGSVKMHFDKGKLQATDGVKDAFSTGQKGKYTTVNYGTGTNDDVANIRSQYAQAQATDNKEHLAYLHSKGIQSVETNDNGDTMITYNQIGKSQMNLSKADNEGNNIVVTKDFGQDATTHWSYSVPEYTGTSQTVTGNTSNPVSQPTFSGMNYGSPKVQASTPVPAPTRSSTSYNKRPVHSARRVTEVQDTSVNTQTQSYGATKTPVSIPVQTQANRSSAANSTKINFNTDNYDYANEIISKAVGDSTSNIPRITLDQDQLNNDFFNSDDSTITD